MLRGNFFDKNEEIRIGGQICPLPVCLGLKFWNSIGQYNFDLANIDQKNIFGVEPSGEKVEK